MYPTVMITLVSRPVSRIGSQLEPSAIISFLNDRLMPIVHLRRFVEREAGVSFSYPVRFRAASS